MSSEQIEDLTQALCDRLRKKFAELLEEVADEVVADFLAEAGEGAEAKAEAWNPTFILEEMAQRQEEMAKEV